MKAIKKSLVVGCIIQAKKKSWKTAKKKIPCGLEYFFFAFYPKIDCTKGRRCALTDNDLRNFRVRLNIRDIVGLQNRVKRGRRKKFKKRASEGEKRSKKNGDKMENSERSTHY